jgi:Flp pilus assembly protein TadD
MTVERDRLEYAGARPPTVVFRPWPPRPAMLPSPTCSSIRPCFVRPSRTSERQDPHPTSRAARPPRFARFAAALQSAGGALRSEATPWATEPWVGARTGVTARAPVDLGEDGPWLGFWRLASLATIEHGLHGPTIRRATLIIGAASVAVLALIALFEPTGGQDRTPAADPAIEAGAPGRLPPTPDRDQPAAAPRAASTPSRLVIDHPPPAQVTEPSTDKATPGRAAIDVNASTAEKAEPEDLAPAPVSLARLSAVVQPAPPRIEASTASLAANGTLAAVAVRAGALPGAAAPDDDPLYELAHRLQDKGQIAHALEAYRMAARANPQHAATYYDWGYLLQKQGDEKGARQKYLMTLRVAPWHAFAHYNLGYILQKHGDYADAVKHYRAAIAANPSFFWSYYNLAYIEQKEGRYREALAEYRKSIRVDPKQALPYENIATILRYHRTN